jgi:hypothetical protein
MRPNYALLVRREAENDNSRGSCVVYHRRVLAVRLR